MHKKTLKFSEWKTECRKIDTSKYHISFDGLKGKIIIKPINKQILS